MTSPPLPLDRRVLRRIFAIPAGQASLERPGFHAAAEVIRARLERAPRNFVAGFEAGFASPDVQELERRLAEIPAELRGFAYEGAAAALVLGDLLTPWRRDRLDVFLSGPGRAHIYMAHVGAGWVMGFIPVRSRTLFSRLDPLLRWLAVDGYGFHQGFFATTRSVDRHKIPSRLRGYERKAFDQGLGRALWFVAGASAAQIVPTIEKFPADRQAELWSGIGLASTYAGGVDPAVISELAHQAGRHRAWLAQGAAFAAKSRELAGNQAAHSEMASQILCRCPAAAAASICDETLPDRPELDESYEQWRRAIRDHFASS